ncbi:Aca2/YdiL-like domain-containing protein [Pseudomonas sp. LRF_L74]|uniref:Aca2/YdiL-like domain-containing protein n=1 Tax=Pseudomonas sp. LRF_L74 TaxID=3369422 RepID=UPI003F5F92F6
MRDSIAPMNNLELQAARKLLMMDVSEAAAEIGKVSPRTWQYWEAGRSPVPTDVALEVEAMLEVRLERMRAIDDQLAQLAEGETLKLPYHTSFETYAAADTAASKTLWRIDQSIAAMYYTEGHAELVA